MNTDDALQKYSEQCSNTIDGKCRYIEANKMSQTPKECKPPRETNFNEHDNDNDNHRRQKRRKHKRRFSFNSSATKTKPALPKQGKSSKSSPNEKSKECSTDSINLQFAKHSIESPEIDISDNRKNQSNIGSQVLDLTPEQCPNQPTITEVFDDDNNDNNLIQCPLCGSLFDTPQAVGVHIDNDHNENNEPSPNKSIVQSQPTPILHRKRQRKRKNLILSADSPPSTQRVQSTKKRKTSAISDESGEETPAIRNRRRKKRKIMDFSDDELNS